MIAPGLMLLGATAAVVVGVDALVAPETGETRSVASETGGTQSSASETGGTQSVASETGGTRSSASSEIPSAEDQPSSNNQPENEKGEKAMNIKQKTVAALAAATLAATPVVGSAATSCIVSGSTDRDASAEIGPIAINSELDTRPAPEVQLDGLNLRTDGFKGFILQII